MSDFIVIGGGIAGLSAGARLAELGRVTLLESEAHLGHHASGRSAALYEESYGKASTVALNKASRAEFFNFDDGVLSPRGLLLVGSAETAQAYAQDQAEMGLAPLPMDEALHLCPILNPEVIDRTAWHEGAWDIDTDRLLQHFARAIRANGEVVTKAPVTAITRSAGWQVDTPQGSYSAPVLVNAAGAWADRVAALAGIAPLGLQPFRRSMARIPAPEGLDPSAWPMVFGAGEAWYFKPDAGALIVSPSEEHPSEPMDAWPEDMVLAEGLDRYQQHVTSPVTRLLASWAGLRTFSPDRQLVLGPEPSDPSFVWSAGQGGYGFQTSPAASRLVADLVAGRSSALEPEVVAALSPARFR